MFHGGRGRRRRPSMQPVIRSYKKIIDLVSASYTTGFSNFPMALGTDSVSAGQTSGVDVAVPTGCILKYIELKFVINNAVAAPIFINTSTMMVLAGQSAIDPRAVGGVGSRNQVIHQDLFGIGQDQNFTRTMKIRIPKRFQRMKEVMSWVFSWSTDGSVQFAAKAIYKFYQ